MFAKQQKKKTSNFFAVKIKTAKIKVTDKNALNKQFKTTKPDPKMERNAFKKIQNK